MCCLSCNKDVTKPPVRGLCPSCYALNYRGGTLSYWPTTYRKMSETLEEYEFLREGGESLNSIAKALGLKVESLQTYMTRIRKLKENAQ